MIIRWLKFLLLTGFLILSGCTSTKHGDLNPISVLRWVISSQKADLKYKHSHPIPTMKMEQYLLEQ